MSAYWMLHDGLPTCEEFEQEGFEEWDFETIEQTLEAIGRALEADRTEAKDHDRKGWFADFAGSEKCLALGHKPTGEDYPEWDEDTHTVGWDGDWLCDETRHGVACTTCESDDCEARRLDVNLWALPGVVGGDRG